MGIFRVCVCVCVFCILYDVDTPEFVVYVGMGVVGYGGEYAGVMINDDDDTLATIYHHGDIC